MLGGASLTKIADDCMDAENGFDKRMGDLASSVWAMSGADGPVSYHEYDPGHDDCGTHRVYVVQLTPVEEADFSRAAPRRPGMSGYHGHVTAAARNDCVDPPACMIVYEVVGP